MTGGAYCRRPHRPRRRNPPSTSVADWLPVRPGSMTSRRRSIAAVHCLRGLAGNWRPLRSRRGQATAPFPTRWRRSPAPAPCRATPIRLQFINAQLGGAEQTACCAWGSGPRRWARGIGPGRPAYAQVVAGHQYLCRPKFELALRLVFDDTRGVDTRWCGNSRVTLLPWADMASLKLERKSTGPDQQTSLSGRSPVSRFTTAWRKPPSVACWI